MQLTLAEYSHCYFVILLCLNSFFYSEICTGEHLYPNSMTSSDEDLLGSENGEGEIHLTPSSTSITLEENTDDDLGKN